MTAFKTIPGPFGGTDERATQEAFVKYVGGRAKAEQLDRLWRNSYPAPTAGFGQLSKEEVFCRKAKREGFKDNEIDAFMML